MWVQEIEFDVSQDPVVCLSEGGFQNVGDISVIELRTAAEDEFGKFVEDILDPDNDDTRIGWKFATTAAYEDSDVGGEFKLETWIILHDEPPEMKFRYHVIKDEDLDGLNEFRDVVSSASLDDPDAPQSMPLSVQEAMESLGMHAGSISDAEEVDDTGSD
jgi:hypothetical protein